MTALAGVLAVLALFAAGVAAGRRAAYAPRDIDEHIARFNAQCPPRAARFFR